MDRRFALFALVVLSAAGCSQNPYISSHLEILGAERRALEDRVLDLEFELERAEKQLDACQDDGDPGSSRGSRPAPDSRPGGADDEGDVTPPSIVIPELEDDTPSTLEPPRVQEGDPIDGELPSPDGGAAIRSPRYRRPGRNGNRPAPVALTSRPPGDPRITHIALNPTLTGGADFDRKSGDDGLVVVLEPRNAENEFVPLAGPITLVLLDYAKRDEGAAAMVARWHVDATNVYKAIVNDEYARGIQLRLPWPDAAPEHSKLRLDVRYTTADGRPLDARADVYVTLPGQFSARWTPRADGGPENRQAPVNVARQPDENDSAARARPSSVVQSSFTAVARAAEIVTRQTEAADPPQLLDAAGSAAENGSAIESAAPRAPARPAWTPNR